MEERHMFWCRTSTRCQFLALMHSHLVHDDGDGEIDPPPKCSQLTLAIQ